MTAHMLNILSVVISMGLFSLYVFISLVFESTYIRVCSKNTVIPINLNLCMGFVFMVAATIMGIDNDVVGMCLWLLSSVLYLSSGFTHTEAICKPTQ